MNTEQKMPDEIKFQIEIFADKCFDEREGDYDNNCTAYAAKDGATAGAAFGYQLGIAGRSKGLERQKELEEALCEVKREYNLLSDHNKSIIQDLNEQRKQIKFWNDLVTQMLLQLEWGDKRITYAERLAKIFNARPELIVAVNEETKSIGLMLNSDNSKTK